MYDIFSLVNQLHKARLALADKKEALLKLQRELEEEKAKVYLRCGKEAHFKACAIVNDTPSIKQLKEKLDAAEMQSYRGWIECNHCANLFSAARGGAEIERNVEPEPREV